MADLLWWCEKSYFRTVSCVVKQKSHSNSLRILKNKGSFLFIFFFCVHIKILRDFFCNLRVHKLRKKQVYQFFCITDIWTVITTLLTHFSSKFPKFLPTRRSDNNFHYKLSILFRIYQNIKHNLLKKYYFQQKISAFIIHSFDPIRHFSPKLFIPAF